MLTKDSAGGRQNLTADFFGFSNVFFLFAKLPTLVTPFEPSVTCCHVNEYPTGSLSKRFGISYIPM